MAEQTRPPQPPGQGQRPNSGGQPSGGFLGGKLPSWSMFLLLAVVIGSVLWFSSAEQPASELRYDELVSQINEDKVKSITWDNTTGNIEGVYAGEGEETFTSTGPAENPQDLEALLKENNVEYAFETPQQSGLLSLLSIILPFALILGFFAWMQRRASGQMSGVMSIGRSKAKTYSAERPGTTFADVAGYDGVKMEIKEVVDFLKEPDRFAAIGARIPKGVLLVGPPGTGKTLIARAVAGEAGVPFMSVTGSDFMEMFVGVGASRVRDLFESARKAGRAIIFVDEIDSIGRKRGAGMGGGHDEREQTLNQMLSEMDGFEATEGIVMMAATNRPDILDPALLRPGRFDRQVVVPLPELEDRRRILEVHVKAKKLSPDVDLNLVARGTPGMSGADLANLVNEAALFAVRNGESEIHGRHFEDARDRVMMGQRRESMVLSDVEKEAIAYHEAGHAVCAAVLPEMDPLHKVTIIPAGMALGVTMTLPDEERHIHRQNFIEDRLVMMLGGRTAEEITFEMASTGASDDLVKATELAHSMVKEWGMSERVGPMAWSSGGAIFLGDDMMQSKSYSDEMARVIDEETEKILRRAQSRCRELLRTEQNGLDLVARQLLEHETIDGAEVLRLVKVGRTGEPGNPPDPGTKPPSVALGEATNGSTQESPTQDPAEVH